MPREWIDVQFGVACASGSAKGNGSALGTDGEDMTLFLANGTKVTATAPLWNVTGDKCGKLMSSVGGLRLIE